MYTCLCFIITGRRRTWTIFIRVVRFWYMTARRHSRYFGKRFWSQTTEKGKVRCHAHQIMHDACHDQACTYFNGRVVTISWNNIVSTVKRIVCCTIPYKYVCSGNSKTYWGGNIVRNWYNNILEQSHVKIVPYPCNSMVCWADNIVDSEFCTQKRPRSIWCKHKSIQPKWAII